MANRRCLQALSRHTSALFSTNPPLHSISTSFSAHESLKAPTFKPHLIFTDPTWSSRRWSHTRRFSSDRNDGVKDEDDDKDSEDDEEDFDDDESEDESALAKGGGPRKAYTAEEREAEAADIGYKVIGQLGESDKVFKYYEPVYAVIQIGSHQFKVSNGDSIFTERLKFCEVNDKLILNKVLLLGSKSQTVIGRPIVPDAAVHAIVEEHALDAKVLIFKKKRRKNYRRCNGHRQELTKLRILDIEGIKKSGKVTAKASKTFAKKPEEVAVAA